MQTSTRDEAEIAKFATLAEEWWNPDGAMKMLHRLNPVRLGYIRDQACAQFGRDRKVMKPLGGLAMLDIGCGGGLVCEPLARMGASMTGLDPTPGNVDTARVHAEAGGLSIDYRAATAEELAQSGAQYDVVLALEVIEHVANIETFIAACAAMVKPGGLFIGATLNRTKRSYLLAIAAAEYVLGWLPRGTHDWNKFVTPDEFAAALEAQSLQPCHSIGIAYSPFIGEWSKTSDEAVNYMIAAKKP